VKIYFAAIDTRLNAVQAVGGVDYALTSFYALRGKGDATVNRVRSQIHKSWMVDSGAFTFMNSGGTCDWEEYVDDYADFINRYQVRQFIELDLYSIIGVQNTETLRARLEAKTHRQCIPVFHPELGTDYYKRMVDAYGYIALGGIVVGKWTNEHQMIPLIRYASRKGVKTHGLGFTRVNKLKQFGFYSVDSTSFVGDRFGQVYRFDGKQLVVTRVAKGRRLDWVATAINNVEQWKLYARHMDDQ